MQNFNNSTKNQTLTQTYETTTKAPDDKSPKRQNFNTSFLGKNKLKPHINIRTKLPYPYVLTGDSRPHGGGNIKELPSLSYLIQQRSWRSRRQSGIK